MWEHWRPCVEFFHENLRYFWRFQELGQNWHDCMEALKTFEVGHTAPIQTFSLLPHNSRNIRMIATFRFWHLKCQWNAVDPMLSIDQSSWSSLSCVLNIPKIVRKMLSHVVRCCPMLSSRKIQFSKTLFNFQCQVVLPLMGHFLSGALCWYPLVPSDANTFTLASPLQSVTSPPSVIDRTIPFDFQLLKSKISRFV